MTEWNSLTKSALRYARFGWPVLPCIPRTKYPATTNGVHDATTDQRQIARWWTQNPEYNIGIAAGVKFDVVDLDGSEGQESWALYVDQTASTLRVRTPHGEHLYFKPFGATNKVRCLPGVDLRGSGGYVIAPPSVNDMGERYEWINAPEPGASLLKFEVPIQFERKGENIVSLSDFRPTRRTNDDFDGAYSLDILRAVADVSEAEPGTRNATLFRKAIWLYECVWRGKIKEEVLREVMLIAANACGLSKDEAIQTLNSARRTAMQKVAND